MNRQKTASSCDQQAVRTTSHCAVVMLLLLCLSLPGCLGAPVGAAVNLTGEVVKAPFKLTGAVVGAAAETTGTVLGAPFRAIGAATGDESDDCEKKSEHED